MERLILLFFAVVFAAIVLTRLLIQKRFHRRYILASVLPIVLLLSYVIFYDSFDVIPPYFNIVLLLLGIAIFLFITFLEGKMSRESVMMIVGFSLQGIAVISIWAFVDTYTVFSAYFAVILLATGTVVFTAGLVLKIRNLFSNRQ